MTIKRFLTVTILALAALACWGQENRTMRFFEITYPEDQDTFVAYGDTINKYSGEEYLIEFNGEISADGVKVRVVWTSGDGTKTDDFTLRQYKSGDAAFVYRASKRLANMEYGSNRYRFIVTFADGTVKEHSLTLFIVHGHVGEKAKPVIYLYPRTETEVSVAVFPEGGVTVSIPEMGAGWKVRARPDGTLVEAATGVEYPYLFWESKDYGPPLTLTEGFVVGRGEMDAWMRDKLAYLGLVGREIDDFMEYWLPVVTEKDYAFIYFHPGERINREAPLSVVPAPDSVIRVYFEYKPLDSPISVIPQKLTRAARSGFSLIEWGGRRY